MKLSDLIGVNQCMMCKQVGMTIGEQDYGGARYCIDCYTQTENWKQLPPATQNMILNKIEIIKANPEIKVILGKVQKLTPAEREAMYVDERKKRIHAAWRYAG